MTPTDFAAFMRALQLGGRVPVTDQYVADLLGVSRRAVTTMKSDGVKGSTARRTALACAAILADLEPFKE